MAREDWSTFAASFIEDYFAAHPTFAVTLGRHEFDGQLPDWSAEGIAREIARLRQARAAAMAFSTTSLDEEHQFERDYLVSRIDRDLFWLETARWPFRSPAFYFDWMLDSLDPNAYVAREYAPVAERMRAFTTYALALPDALKQIQTNLETPMPRTYVDYGVSAFGGLATYFVQDVPLAFASVTDPEQTRDFQVANQAAIEALQQMTRWLEGQRAAATEDFALGPKTFRAMVAATEGLDIDLETLRAAGIADLERNTRALQEACEALAPRRPLQACIAKVQAKKPQGGAVEGARRQLAGLREFLIAQDLVTIPGSESALVEEAPPYKRQNFAYIDVPGPYERGLPATYYIAPPDPAWTKAERNAYVPGQADLLFTSVHEVWPGHFLQFLHSNRTDSRVGQVFVGYAFSEGWAHYAEEMMWEAGIEGGTADIHVGQLLNALLRNVRFLAAIGLHTGAMTVADAERMFAERAHQDPGNARQQAARGTYDPAYLNYTLGKLMIRKLRTDWTAKHGGRSAWHQFHDTILSHGGPPVPLLRARMLGSASGNPL